MKKEEIRNNPLKIFRAIQRKDPNVRLIEIELIDEDKNLLLKAHDLSKGKVEGDQLKDLYPHFISIHGYDENGRNFFKALIPSFGKIRVFFAGKDQLWISDNYEEFLSKIIRDP